MNILAALALTLCLGIEQGWAQPMESSSDAFDTAVGTELLADSGVLPGSNAGDMFGQALSSVEPGNLLFSDSNGDGFIHSVEWQTAVPIRVAGFNLFATHDGDDTTRAFGHVLIAAYVDDAFVTIYESDVAVPYQHLVDTLVLSSVVDEVEARRFRAEFTEGSPTSAAGPRVRELDAYTVDPCGDANFSGDKNATDALLTLRAAVGLAECPDCMCNADGAGATTASDALLVLREAVGLDPGLNCVSCLFVPPTSTTTTTTTLSTTTTTTTTTTLPPKLACGAAGTSPPSCNGYCSSPGFACVEWPPMSGVCSCLGTPLMCGQDSGPPTCTGACPQFFVCKLESGVCQCIF